MDATKNDCLCYFSMRTTSNVNQQIAKEDYEYINRLDSTAKRKDLVYAKSQNLPAWADNDPAFFWKMVTELENPQGRQAVHIRAALPNALTMDENIRLMEEFINKMTTHEEGLLTCSYAVHLKKRKKPNPHFHLIIYERPLNPISMNQEVNIYFKKANRHYPERGGVKKVEYFTQRGIIKMLRKLWADTANKFLEKAQSILRMNPLSYRDRGIAKIPQIPLGPKDSYFYKRGISTPRSKVNEDILFQNNQLEKMDMVDYSLERLQEFWRIFEKEDFRIPLGISLAEKEMFFFASSLLNSFFQAKSLEELIVFYRNEYRELDLVDQLERIVKYLILDAYKLEEISTVLLAEYGELIDEKELSALYNEIYYTTIQETDWISDIQFLFDEAIIEVQEEDAPEVQLENHCAEYIPKP